MILVGFSRDLFARLVVDHLESLGNKILEIDKFKLDSIDASGRISWSALAWKNRKSGFETHLYGLSEEINTASTMGALLQCCDRVFLEPLPVADLLGYNGALIGYAEEALRPLPPQAPLVFLASPHFPDDMALALVAQSQGRSVFAVRTCAVNNYVWMVKLFGLNPCSLFLPGAKESFRSQIGSEESERIRISKQQNQDLKRLREVRHGATLGGMPSRAARYFLPDALNRRLNIKPLRRDSNHYWGYLGRWGMTRVRLRHSFRRIRIRRLLPQIETPTLPKRFIYVALHFQPERSTLPEAGVFRNQAILISEVATFCTQNPDLGLEVVVKDHPRQNNGDIRQHNFRDTEFYLTLAKYPNVRIVNQYFETEDLIRKARAVVTANGSSAWEALCAGVPALTGTFTWHSTCSASPVASAPDDIGRKLPELLRLSSEDVRNALEAFLDSLSFLFPGSISSKHLLKSTQHHDLARRMAENVSQIVHSDEARWIPIGRETGTHLEGRK